MRVKFFLVGIIALGFSCGWFDARNPEAPSDSGVEWRQPTQARYVVENIRNTLEGLDLGLYARCAEQDSFAFHADPAQVENDPSRYAGWTWSVEEEVTRLLFQSIEEHWGEQDSAVVILLQDEDWLVSETDSALVQYSYDVVFHHGRIGVDSTGVGTLRWRMLKNSMDRLWYLAGWWDFEQEGEGGWTSLKGGFRN